MDAVESGAVLGVLERGGGGERVETSAEGAVRGVAHEAVE